MIRSSARLLALQLGMFVALGLPDGALGVAWPGMRASFHRSTADLGYVLVAGTAGYLLGSASTGRLIERLGAGRLAFGATAVAVAGLTGEAGAPSWTLLLLGAAVLGGARGATDAGLNAHVAEHGGVRQLGLLHAAYGIGTTASPLIATALLTAGWRWAWIILACVTAALAVWAWPWRGLWPGKAAVAPASSGRLVWSAAFVLTLVTFAIYVGAEFGTASWTFVLLAEHRGMDRTYAGLVVAAFWAALTIGRLVLWRRGDRIARTTILHVSCSVAVAGLVGLALNPANLGWVGVPLAGLGMAAVFPTLVALTPDRLGPERAATAIGLSVAAASLGGAGLSALVGVLPIAPTLAAYGALLLVSHAALSAVSS